MYMKRILISLIMACAAALGASAQVPNDLLVTMPQPPSSLTRLDERCNFIVDNYWKTFNPKSSFSSLERLDKTLGMFLSFTPYASADTVFGALDKMLEAVGKAKPDNLLTMAQMAERYCYSDSAEYDSEELYMHFLEPVVTNKKVKGAEKARFAHQYKQLQNSAVGATPADFEFTRPDGTKGRLSDVKTAHILLFFYDPDCMDCRLAKTRLAADYTLGALQRMGLFTMMAIYPGEPTQEWRDDAASLPSEWIVGALPDAEDLFTMRKQPEIYYLDPKRKVAVKDIDTTQAIDAFKIIAAQYNQ